MKKIFNTPILFVIFFSFLICGCAGQTKPYIPDVIPEIENGMSRIVLTREQQIAGAGSPMIVIDIGENIHPNSMMYINNLSVEDILEGENIASLSGAPVYFMWFNSRMVQPLYCGNKEPGCIEYHWRWPHDKSNGFLFGGLAVVGQDCTFYRAIKGGIFPVSLWQENCPQKKILDIDDIESFRKNENEHVDISEYSQCIKENALIIEKHKQGFQDSCLKNQAYVFTRTTDTRLNLICRDVNGILTCTPDYERLTSSEYDEIIDNRKISRNVQVLGSVQVGDTLIWDRKPGIMRLGSVWYDGVGFMPKNIKIEAGRTYFLHYTTRFGQRWELKKVE